MIPAMIPALMAAFADRRGARGSGTDPAANAGGDAEPTLFEAVIVPHRSLTQRGRRRLIAVICLLCGVMALRFLLLGAWPVVVFSVLEVGLAVLLLWVNARQARASELVLLTERTLRVVRTTPGGRRTERTLSSGWLNVVLEETPGRAPRLVLVAHGVREEIGTALGEAARRELACTLGDALYRARNPKFYNPQLQD